VCIVTNEQHPAASPSPLDSTLEHLKSLTDHFTCNLELQCHIHQTSRDLVGGGRLEKGVGGGDQDFIRRSRGQVGGAKGGGGGGGVEGFDLPWGEGPFELPVEFVTVTT
jgi:hypothetical protein